jgi:decaprenylphospho-beta-D-ribofuranose 2-oxidase
MESLKGIQTELTNWSKSARSVCSIYKVTDITGIATAMTVARTHHISVVPHGAGHSYTDAALNTGAIVIDVSSMNRILSWDSSSGIMCVEPGVTLRDVVQIACKDGWWPAVSPSTPDVTIAGCVAMNVNGRNAWKCGPFGSNILSMDVLLTTGEICTFTPGKDIQLFRAFVGSLGLLGILISITLHLQRVSSGFVTIRRRSASSLGELLTMFVEEEQNSDFMEAWLDGFVEGNQLGRGIISCASLENSIDTEPIHTQNSNKTGLIEKPLLALTSYLARPILMPGMQIANRVNYWHSRWFLQPTEERHPLFPYTFWPSVAFAAYHAIFLDGVETFHAFVSGQYAEEIFEQVLRHSQQQGCTPIWCVIKKHRRDPFLLSYQVDGFSLELNYLRTYHTVHTLEKVLKQMIAIVVESGGRFYLAKDRYLTHIQYRQSLGDQVIDTFFHLKKRLDPDTLLQSVLFRRVFQP